MFTGIIEEVGAVETVRGDQRHRRLHIRASETLQDLTIGASIAVDGVCLTVVEKTAGTFAVEIVAETLARTTLGSRDVGDRVNLERPLQASGRLDGHIVQGHVDGVGEIAAVFAEGEGRRLRIRPPTQLLRYLVEKGSVTVDGVSLTVAATGDDTFEVALIPHTLAVTTLADRAAGDGVNLEVDILAKYVERLLEPIR